MGLLIDNCRILPSRREEIYRDGLKTYGVDAQLDMIIEECSELIKAICKYKRDKNHSNITQILDEMADVDIMIEQGKIIFDNDFHHYVDTAKASKIDRHNERILKFKTENGKNQK